MGVDILGKKTNLGFRVYYQRFQTVVTQLSSDKCKRQTKVTAMQNNIKFGLPKRKAHEKVKVHVLEQEFLFMEA